MINKQALQLIKKGTIILNIGRGPLVNNNDLIESLKNKHIGGYASDVVDGEGCYELF